MTGRRILFVTWDGPQLNYLESLFLPIFAGLTERGHRVHVLQFTWGERQTSMEDACRAQGIACERIDITRAGGAAGALWTAVRGARHIDRAVRRWKIDLLMPRSTMPAVAVPMSKAARTLDIIFDSDGLPIDERVDFAGLDPLGATYRILRAAESQMVRRAGRVLVRTEAAAAILRARAGAGSNPDKFDVVSNGRDLRTFEGLPERTQTRNKSPHLCYLGSLGEQYEPAAMLALAASMREQLPELHLSIFTGDTNEAERRLEEAGLRGAPWITLECLPWTSVPERLAQCDIGLALRRPSFSMAGVAPIKIGDYLLSGLPIVGTAGIGDIDSAIEAGVFLPIGGADDAAQVVRWWTRRIVPQLAAVRRRCREIGSAKFSLQHSIELYDRAIARLA